MEKSNYYIGTLTEDADDNFVIKAKILKDNRVTAFPLFNANRELKEGDKVFIIPINPELFTQFGYLPVQSDNFVGLEYKGNKIDITEEGKILLETEEMTFKANSFTFQISETTKAVFDSSGFVFTLVGLKVDVFKHVHPSMFGVTGPPKPEV